MKKKEFEVRQLYLKFDSDAYCMSFGKLFNSNPDFPVYLSCVVTTSQLKFLMSLISIDITHRNKISWCFQYILRMQRVLRPRSLRSFSNQEV